MKTAYFLQLQRFSKDAHISGEDAYKKLYAKSIEDPEAFWSKRLLSYTGLKWDSVLDRSDAPFYKWFDGSRTNLSYNCLDRHIEEGRGEKTAITGG